MSSSSSTTAAADASTNYYAELQHDEDEELRTKSLYFVLFAALLAVVLILDQKLHELPATIRSFLSEASLVLIVGMIVGAVICFFLPELEPHAENNNGGDDDGDQQQQQHVLAHSLLSFSPNVFFMALLPPIIFNSGYELRRELFYRHIGPILGFACIGTTVSALSTGLFLFGISSAGWMGDDADFTPTVMEFLTFGALIAATDTVSVLSVFQAKKVDPHLFYLVFGESALNDAVALVLFNTFADFLKTEFGDARSVLVRIPGFGLKLAAEAIGSPAVGMTLGWLTAYLFKRVDFRQQKHLELPLYLLMMYVPFVAAECLDVSGIVAIFFAGISARRYIVPNVTEDTKKNGQTIFKVAAFLAETCIFLELGLSVFGLPGSFNWAFIGWAFLASLMGRAIGIYPFAFFYNFRLKEKIIEPAEHGEEIKITVSKEDGLLRIDSCDSSVSSSGSTTQKKRKKRRKTPTKRKDKQITLAMTHVLWFAGLRGAVAYACVRSFPNLYGNADEFVAATMVIVLVSIIIMGGVTESLLHFLGIEMGVDEDDYMEEWHRQRELKGWFHDYGTFSIAAAHFCSLISRTCTDMSSFIRPWPPEYTYAYQTAVREPKAPDCDDSVGSTLGAYFDYQADPAMKPPPIVGDETKVPEP